MANKKLYDVAIPLGNYEDRNGVEKTRWVFVIVSCVYQFMIYALAVREAVRRDNALVAGQENMPATPGGEA